LSTLPYKKGVRHMAAHEHKPYTEIMSGKLEAIRREIRAKLKAHELENGEIVEPDALAALDARERTVALEVLDGYSGSALPPGIPEPYRFTHDTRLNALRVWTTPSPRTPV